jgi:hypothetical protein
MRNCLLLIMQLCIMPSLSQLSEHLLFLMTSMTSRTTWHHTVSVPHHATPPNNDGGISHGYDTLPLHDMET